MQPNRLNLKKSVKNPYSRLAKVLISLRFVPFQPKVVLVQYALGKNVKKQSARGYASYLFGEARQQGLLYYNRQSKVWDLTHRGQAVADRLLAELGVRGNDVGYYKAGAA